MATLDCTKVAQAQCDDEWFKQVVHFMTNKSNHKGSNKDDDEFVKKETQLCKEHVGLLEHMMKGNESSQV